MLDSRILSENGLNTRLTIDTIHESDGDCLEFFGDIEVRLLTEPLYTFENTIYMTTELSTSYIKFGALNIKTFG